MVLTTLRRIFLVLVVSCGITSTATAQKDQTLLNVSYDPTRELYRDINAAFVRHWQAQHVTRFLV